MSQSDYRTDALPTPPREKKHFFPGDKKEYYGDSDEENSEHSSPTSSPKHSTNNINITVSNSKVVHIGTKTIINYGTSNNIQPKRKFYETPSIKRLMGSSDVVTHKDINLVSEHMCNGWEDTARALGYSDGQIDNFKSGNDNGLKETKYKFLRDWMEENSYKATVGTLASTLWQMNQRQVVELWSEKYKELHS